MRPADPPAAPGKCPAVRPGGGRRTKSGTPRHRLIGLTGTNAAGKGEVALYLETKGL